MTESQISDIIAEVERKLKDAGEKSGVALKVSDHRLDDDWLYVVIVPEKAGVNASDHALLMSRIERSLREQGVENVLLVPAIDDE
ncbi:MAG: hypothetical protein WD768_20480 [Phycisphaeraceae bacterium]